jgi:hypothetical protein
MDELPYRTAIDLLAAIGKFGHEPAQGEVALSNAELQPEMRCCSQTACSPEITLGL